MLQPAGGCCRWRSGSEPLDSWGGRCLSGDYGRSSLQRQSNFHFEMDLDKIGERMFGSEGNAGVSFQIGQLRYILFHDEYIPVHTQYIPGTYWIWFCFSCCKAGDWTVPLTIVVDIDGSFVKHKIPVKPIYVKGDHHDGAWNEVWVGFVWVCTSTNQEHTFHPKYVPSTY